MSQLKDIGFHLIYPPGCKEVHEGLKVDELKRRLSDLMKCLENLSDEIGNAQDSLLNDTQIEISEKINSTDTRFSKFQGLLLHLSSEQFTDHRDSEVQVRVALSLCYIIKIANPNNLFTCYTDPDATTKYVLKFLLKCVKELSRMKSKGDKLFMMVYTVLSICCEINIFRFHATVSEGDSILSDVIHVFFEIVRRASDWGEDQMLTKIISDAMVKLLSSPDSPISETLVTYLLNLLVDRCSSKVQKTVVLELLTKCINELQEQIQMVLQNFMIKNEIEDDLSESSDNDEGINDDDELCSLDSYKLMQKRTEKVKPKLSKVVTGKNTIEHNLEYGCHHVFHMIYEIFQISEGIIMPLLPTIEMKLRSTNVTDRKRACRLIGKLFASSGSNDNANQCSLWETFLGRLCDIELEVREICVRVARDLLKRTLENPDNCGIMTLPKEKEDLVRAFQKRSNDQEESIRYLIALAVSQILEQSRTIVQDAELDTVSEAMFKLLLHQSRDKFLSVRKEALSTMGKLYRKIISVVEDKSNENGEVDLTLGLRHLGQSQKSRVELLLNMLLRPYLSTEVDDRIMVERLFNTSLVPYAQDSSSRMKSLLQCLTLCDEPSVLCINEMFKTQVTVMNIVRQTVALLGEASPDLAMSPALSQKLREKVKKLSDYLSSKDKVDSLTKLFNQARSDKKLNELLHRFVDKDSTRQVIVKTIMDIKKHFPLQVPKTAVETTAAAATKRKAFVGTVKCIFERGAPIIFDVECVQELLSHCVSAKEALESSPAMDENMVPLSRTLRLLHTLMLMSRKLVPLHDAYGYLSLVMSTLDEGPRQMVSHDEGAVARPPQASKSSTSTIEELCLLVLSKMVECAPSVEGDGEVEEVAGQDRYPTLFSEFTDDVVQHTEGLLAYLEGRCVTSSADSSTFNSQRKRKDLKEQQDKEAVELSKWKYDCKVAKLVSQCLAGLLRSCRYEMRSNHNDNARLKGLSDQLFGLLSNIVKRCRECEPYSAHQPVMLTSLTHISINLSNDFENDIRVYMKDIVANLLEEGSTTKAVSSSKNLTLWQPEADVSRVTQVRIQALKLLSRWVVTLKADVAPDKQCIILIMSSLRKYIGNYGTEGYTGDTSDQEMSHLRLAAGKCWLRIAQVQSFLPIFDVMWIYRLSSLVYDPCPQVRNEFLRKLHVGLYKLRLPLEYMAMFVFVSKIKNQEYLNLAKKYLHTNIVRRRDFLDTYPEYLSDAKKLFGVLPEYVLSFVIHMLAHDPDWKEIGDDESLGDVKQCLWFIMEPILKLNENYSFIRKLLERIKHAQDATDPSNALMNEKMYICSDIALGLLISKQSSYDLKDYPVELKLPRTRYVPAPNSFSNPDFSSILLDNCTRARIQFSPTPKSKLTIKNCMPAILIKGYCAATDNDRGDNVQEPSLDLSQAVRPAVTKPKKHMAKIVMGVPEMESEGIAGHSLQKKKPETVRKGVPKHKLPRSESPQSEKEETSPGQTSVTKRGRLCKPNIRVMKDMVSPTKKSILHLSPSKESELLSDNTDRPPSELGGPDSPPKTVVPATVPRKRVPITAFSKRPTRANKAAPSSETVIVTAAPQPSYGVVPPERRPTRQTVQHARPSSLGRGVAHSLMGRSSQGVSGTDSVVKEGLLMSSPTPDPEEPMPQKGRATPRSTPSTDPTSPELSQGRVRVTRGSVALNELSSPSASTELPTQSSTSKTDSSTPKSPRGEKRTTRNSVSTPIHSVEPPSTKTDSPTPISTVGKVRVTRRSASTLQVPEEPPSQRSTSQSNSPLKSSPEKISVSRKSTLKANSSPDFRLLDKQSPAGPPRDSPTRSPVKRDASRREVISSASPAQPRTLPTPAESPVAVTLRSKRLASHVATVQLVKKMKR